MPEEVKHMNDIVDKLSPINICNVDVEEIDKVLSLVEESPSIHYDEYVYPKTVLLRGLSTTDDEVRKSLGEVLKKRKLETTYPYFLLKHSDEDCKEYIECVEDNLSKFNNFTEKELYRLKISKEKNEKLKNYLSYFINMQM